MLTAGILREEYPAPVDLVTLVEVIHTLDAALLNVSNL